MDFNSDVAFYLTLKTGKFSFSRKYDKSVIEPMLVEARVLYQTIRDLPILPALASQLDRELMRKSILGTAAIEGNPVTEDEVGELMNTPPQDFIDRGQQEIVNLIDAYSIFHRRPQEKTLQPVSEAFIKEAHKK